MVVALSAIRANKLRSSLTMLGIVIGVGAVIAMIALGSGARKAVQDQIQALGTDLLNIYPGQSMFRGVASAVRVSITMDDYVALARDAPSLAAVVPELSRNVQVKFGNQNINVSVVGSTAAYVPVNRYRIEAGRMFTAGDDEARRRVAVLGYGVPDLLGQNRQAIVGQNISIGGNTYEILGVLSTKGAQMGFGNPDEQILIPLQTARFRQFGTDRLRSVTVQVGHPDSVNLAYIDIERVMRREHQIPPGGDNDFQIRNRSEFLSTFQQTTETFTFLLGGIAAISLIVGGIGIMNIMLVSVTERTREIGVRMALGATRKNIMLQFLVESVVLCLLGGVLGILLGAGGAIALSELAKWNTLVSPSAIVLAFAFSGAVGVFFGLWPARRAAKMDPIVALRYE